MSTILHKGYGQNTHGVCQRTLLFSWSSDEPQRSVNLCRHMEGRPEEADTGCLPSDGTVLRWRTGTLGPGSQLWVLPLLLIICITWEANESQRTSSWLEWMPCRTVGSHKWEPLSTAREALCTVHMTHTCHTAEDGCQDMRLSQDCRCQLLCPLFQPDHSPKGWHFSLQCSQFVLCWCRCGGQRMSWTLLTGYLMFSEWRSYWD